MEASDLKVRLLNSYFRGSHYLMEAEFENQKVFFESEHQIPIGSLICLKIK